MNKNYNFTAANREQLISEVQSKSILRSDRHKDYKNTEKTKNQWDKIGENTANRSRISTPYRRSSSSYIVHHDK